MAEGGGSRMPRNGQPTADNGQFFSLFSEKDIPCPRRVLRRPAGITVPGRVGSAHRRRPASGGRSPPTPFKVFFFVVSQVRGQSQCGGSGSRSSFVVAVSSVRVSSWGIS